MPPLSVFRASCYAPVPCFFRSYHAGIQTCHLPRWQTAGVPAHIRSLAMSVKCCPPECGWEAPFDHFDQLKWFKEKRWTSAALKTTNTGAEIRRSDELKKRRVKNPTSARDINWSTSFFPMKACLNGSGINVAFCSSVGFILQDGFYPVTCHHSLTIPPPRRWHNVPLQKVASTLMHQNAAKFLFCN